MDEESGSGDAHDLRLAPEAPWRDGDLFADQLDSDSALSDPAVAATTPPRTAPTVDEAFEVEEVLDKRIFRRSSRLDSSDKVQYLIKWMGHGDNANSWEPVEALGDCLTLVAAYEERAHDVGDSRRRVRDQVAPRT